MSKELEQKLNEVDELITQYSNTIKLIKSSSIVDVDLLNSYVNEFTKLRHFRDVLTIKQKTVGKYNITYDKEVEYVKIMINKDLKYEETIDFNGLLINIDKNYEIKSIENERGDLNKFFENLNEDLINDLMIISKGIVNYTKMLDMVI